MPSTPVVVLDSTLTSIANAIRSKTGGSATMTPGQMPAQIMSIPSGGGVGIPREVSAQGVFQMPSQSFAFSLPTGVTSIGASALKYAFYNGSGATSVDFSTVTKASANACEYAFYFNTGITSVDLSSLTTVEGYAFCNAFFRCTSLVSVDISSLATVNANANYAFDCAFQNCTSLTSVNLSSLKDVRGSSTLAGCFTSCSALTSIDLSSLEVLWGTGIGLCKNMFSQCTSLASIDLSSLSRATGNNVFENAFKQCAITTMNFNSLSDISSSKVFLSAFSGCTALTELRFPALTTSSFGSYTDQFNKMLQGCTGVTVHFPAAIQSTIGSWASVTGGFGGTNTTVLFDL